MKKPSLISLMALGTVAWSMAGETLPPISSRTLDEATRNKVLLINEGSEPHTLDPQAARDASEYHIIMGLIEGLVGCHPVSYTHLTLPTIYSV